MSKTAIQWTVDDILNELTRNREHLQALGVRSLGLFGSYRNDVARPDSDMDFLVDLARPSFDTYMEIKFWLEDTFERPIDLVLIDTLKPRLQSHILDEVVYAEGLSPLSRRHPGGDSQD
jgi:hypothetical protein